MPVAIQTTANRSPSSTPGFSSPDAIATPWAEARKVLADAEISWLSTVRPDGRPHVTPMASVLECVLTTGRNALGEGLDVVIEGEAVGVTDTVTLRRVADAFTEKYPEPFHFTLDDGAFTGEGGVSLVFAIRPDTAFGFGRGETFNPLARGDAGRPMNLRPPAGLLSSGVPHHDERVVRDRRHQLGCRLERRDHSSDLTLRSGKFWHGHDRCGPDAPGGVTSRTGCCYGLAPDR